MVARAEMVRAVLVRVLVRRRERGRSMVVVTSPPRGPESGGAVDWTQVAPVDLVTAGFPCQNYPE
jgi:hypothetical protein